MSESAPIARDRSSFDEQEKAQALRALLMVPLMNSTHPHYFAVLRHASALREWFSRETGWSLRVDRDCVRLYKLPADLLDPTRGLAGYDRRTYIVLSLCCGVLERAGPQITLHDLGERLLDSCRDPALAERDFTFELTSAHERRNLVQVCRSLIEWGVLRRLVGDEEGFIHYGSTGTENTDALYDVQRRALACVLAAVRGPSTWSAQQAPKTLDDRLHALVDEPFADSPEGQRTAMRHHLSRRLLDDPVVYINALADEEKAYFLNQRGAMALRLCQATELAAEQRAEGLALVDEGAELTDLRIPSQGTSSHIALLVAEFLAADLTQSKSVEDVAYFISVKRDDYGRYWSKFAREKGSDKKLAQEVLEILSSLSLVVVRDGVVECLPALARFKLGSVQYVDLQKSEQSLSLF